MDCVWRGGKMGGIVMLGCLRLWLAKDQKFG